MQLFIFRCCPKASHLIQSLADRFKFRLASIFRLRQQGHVFTQQSNEFIYPADGLVCYELLNPVCVTFTFADGQPFIYHFVPYSTVGTVRRFLANFHFFCPEWRLHLCRDSKVLQDNDPITEQDDPTFQVLIDLTDQISLTFHLSDARNDVLRDFHLFCLDQDCQLDHAVSRLASVLEISQFCMRVTDGNGKQIDDDTRLLPYDGKALNCTIFSSRVQFSYQRSIFCKLEQKVHFLNKFPSGRLARQILSRKWNIKDPELLRLTFNREIIQVEQNLIFLRTSRKQPIIVTLMKYFTFIIGKEQFELPFSEDDTVEQIIQTLEAIRHCQIQELRFVSSYRLKNSNQSLKRTDRLGRVDEPILVVLERTEREIHISFGVDDTIVFRCSPYLIVDDLLGRVVSQCPKRFCGINESDIVLCGKTFIYNRTDTVESLESSVFCLFKTQQICCNVELPNGELVACSLSVTGRTKDLHNLIAEKYKLCHFTICGDGSDLMYEQFLCSVIFFKNHSKLIYRHDFYIFRLKAKFLVIFQIVR